MGATKEQIWSAVLAILWLAALVFLAIWALSETGH
jgi:hypothetical protein